MSYLKINLKFFFVVDKNFKNFIGIYLDWMPFKIFYSQIRDCYDSKYQTADYNNSWGEIRRLSDYEMEKRQTKKFVSFWQMI